MAQSGSGVNNDQTRRLNLSTVLTALHHDGAQSRSQLTARTGLNRSTIAALVAELASLGLVFESRGEPSASVGRPSPVVRVAPGVAALAVNPEVDAITVGLVSLGGEVVERVRIETPQAPSVEDAVGHTVAALAGLRARHPGIRIVAAALAVPGLVRAGDGLVRLAPHLGWTDAPAAAALADATGLEVFAANDASLGARAELLFGAGRGLRDLVYLNGGASGIGGGIISGGSDVAGAGGYAGEFGHVRMGAGSAVLEDEVTRAALVDALRLGSPDADELEAALLASADPLVAALVARQLEALSSALGSVVTLLNPEIVVLGGFLASLDARSPGFLAESVARHALSVPVESVRIERARLGSDLLMIGAAELAFAPLLLDPAGNTAGR